MINDSKGDAINCNELGNQITVWEKNSEIRDTVGKNKYV